MKRVEPTPARSPTDALVSVRNLTVDFGATRALKAVSLTLRPGSTGLLGPNGAGKTTLLRVLLGLVTPTSGEVRVAGHDPSVREQRLLLRRSVGYMPESDCLIAGMSGVELVSFLGRVSGLSPTDAMTRAHDVLFYAGLEEVRYRDCQTYSTGLKQRLKLAQALVHDPPILLLDEPTNGLDPKGRLQMLELVADLAGTHGKSLLLCSHLLPDVERVCRDVIVLSAGDVAAQGEITAITRSEGTWVDASFGGDADAVLHRFVESGTEAVKVPAGLRVRLPDGSTDADCIFAAAAECGVTVTSVTPVRRTLEDVFLGALRMGEGRARP